MIYLGFPYGYNFGWGVLGKEIAFALSRLAEVRVLSPPGADQRLDDEFDLFQMRKLVTGVPETQAGELRQVDGPVIQSAVGRGLDPFVPNVAPPFHVGYAVFEENILAEEVVALARQRYRHLAAGSSYCAEVLRQHGQGCGEKGRRLLLQGRLRNRHTSTREFGFATQSLLRRVRGIRDIRDIRDMDLISGVCREMNVTNSDFVSVRFIGR